MSTRTLYLVRHAKAGDRSAWEGPDRERPLNKAGRRQADALAERLVAAGATELHSSPYVRCRETLAPLALFLGTVVGEEDALAEGAPVSKALDLIASLPDGAVACSHGDVIPDVMAALERRGCEITTPADWRKATVWVIRSRPDGCDAHVWPPPA